ncbi:vascular cell adhesion protein 1b isoform X3 [Festucalex cinctus]
MSVMTTRLPLACFLLSGALAAAGVQVNISPAGESLLKLGERAQLSCDVRDCPAAPVIAWTPLGDRPLGAGVRTRDRLSLLTFDPVEMMHEGPLLCQVTCGGQRKHAKTDIRVYAFPRDPEIGGHDPVGEGEEATWTCRVRDLYPAEMLTLDWLRGGQVVRSVAGEAGAASVQSAYTFTPGRAESGDNLTCRATLDLRQLDPSERRRQTVARLDVAFAPAVTSLSEPLLTWTFTPEGGGPPQVKGQGEELTLAAQAGDFRCEARNRRGTHSKVVRVRLHAAPVNTSLQVSPSQQVAEGQRVTFTCRAAGDPPPKLLLSRQGAELCRSDSAPRLTFSLSVRPEDSARYRCDATNAFGTQHVTRKLTVAAPPTATSVTLLPSATVRAGHNVTVTCQSDGFPPPDFVLEKASDGTRRRASDGVFRLLDVSARHSGVYRVNASNVAGFHVRHFLLSVTESDGETLPVLGAVLLPAAVGAGGLAVAVLVADYLRRSRKKGSYRLAPPSDRRPLSDAATA